MSTKQGEQIVLVCVCLTLLSSLSGHSRGESSIAILALESADDFFHQKITEDTCGLLVVICGCSTTSPPSGQHEDHDNDDDD